MRWTRGDRSSDIEDRRGEGGGGFGGLRVGGGIGIGGAGILLGLSLVFGQNFFGLLGGGGGAPGWGRGACPGARAAAPRRPRRGRCRPPRRSSPPSSPSCSTTCRIPGRGSSS